MDEHYPYILPPLPFACGALTPELDARVLAPHHDQYFAAEIKELNRLLEPYPACQKWSLQNLCLNWAELPEDIRRQTRCAAAGILSHDLYFLNLQAVPVSAPLPPLEGAISRAFGPLSELKRTMREAALSQTGSGWVWLCADGDGELSVRKSANDDLPLPLYPLLCCDLWEHAYAPQYQTRRGEYFDNWWRLVNWPRVSLSYEHRIAGKPPRPMP